MIYLRKVVRVVYKCFSDKSVNEMLLFGIIKSQSYSMIPVLSDFVFNDPFFLDPKTTKPISASDPSFKSLHVAKVAYLEYAFVPRDVFPNFVFHNTDTYE